MPDIPELISYKDSRLRLVSREAMPGDPDLGDLIQAMTALMRIHDGVGLAAPQVGDDRRIIVTRAPGYRKKHGSRVLLNPVIESVSEQKSVFREGCLSFPGIYRNVRRPVAARIGYLDLDGHSSSLETEGLLARIILHEIDHLDGILFIDHLSFWRRREVDLRMRLRSRGNRLVRGGRC